MSGGAPAMGARAALGTRPALVVIDMSRGFTDAASPVGAAVEGAVAATAELLEAARAQGRPVAFTTVVFDAAAVAAARAFLAKGPGMRALTPGSAWVEIDPRLEPAASEPVFPKCFPSAFFATPLDSWLAAAGADSLVLAGVSTSGCVRATAVDGVSHGFTVLVAREAVGDRDVVAHEASLRDIDLKYGNVVGREQALAVLSGAAEAS